MKKRIRYFVNTGGKIVYTRHGFQTFMEFNCPKAALRYLKSNPRKNQIDVRGTNHRGRLLAYCWKYWDKGKICTQKREFNPPVYQRRLSHDRGCYSGLQGLESMDRAKGS